MPGIYIAAILTIALSSGLAGLVISKRMQASDQSLAAAGVIGGIAAFFGAFYLLRVPLDNALRSLMQNDPAWYRVGTTFYAPLTEEPAKWAILIPIFLMGRIKQASAGAWAICLGFGFGIGEIAFLAQRIASDPRIPDMPWYLSSGFIVERLMVCFIHSALVLMAADALCYRKFWGMFFAPCFHWLLNLPIFLSYQYPLDPTGVVWGQLLWIWIIIFFAGALIYLGQRMLTPTERIAAFLGKAMCPECQTLYVRPLWGINRLGEKRYERCPQCKRYHWTTRYH